MRNPSLIRWVYGAHWLVHLHKWQVYPAVVRQMKRLKQGAIVADVGFGEGQYSIGLAARFPHLHFCLVDRHQDHIDFAKAYLRYYPFSHSLIPQQADCFELVQRADLMLCIGVLQYCQDDQAVLRNFAQQVLPGGRLLLYVPVHGREIGAFYQRLRKRWPDYEAIQRRQRIYQPDEIVDKLQQAGWRILSRKFTYGTAGILSNEWLNSWLLVLVHGNLWMKAVGMLILCLSWPILFLLMMIDFAQNLSTGNCLLIEAERESTESASSL